MNCPRCGSGMRERRRTFHKQRKWTCPRCGRARMQVAAARRRGPRLDLED